MKLRTLTAAAALIVAGSLPAAFAQDTTPKATGAGVGKYPKAEMADEAMKKCGQEAAGEARETCLKRFRAEQGSGSGSTSTGTGNSTGSGSPPTTPKSN